MLKESPKGITSETLEATPGNPLEEILEGTIVEILRTTLKNPRRITGKSGKELCEKILENPLDRMLGQTSGEIQNETTKQRNN